VLRQLVRGLRALIRRSDADRDVEDEVRHYLDEATAAFVADGLSPAAARRAAQLEIGNTTIVREQVRAYGWENLVSTFVSDVRYAARRLRGSPGFTAVAVSTLALGIGASTAIFSAVNPILFQPLPYPHAQRVMMVWDQGVDGSRIDVTFGTYRELAERSRSFDTMAVMKPWQATITGAAQPERLVGQRVSAGYFHALGLPPALGRDFQASEDRAHGPNVVILSDALWRRRFNGDATIVGRDITLNDNLFTVVGVMPAAFENVLAPSAEIWSPLQYDATLPPDGREWGHHLRMVARLRAGAGRGSAAQEMDVIARTPVADFTRMPWASMSRGLIVSALQDDVTRSVKPGLIAILGAVMLVLAIACVNVTNLLLGRGAQRRGEFAMRAALGAGRGRIMIQLLTESLLLAVLGGALGMGLAALGVRALVALSPPGLPRVSAIRLDSAVFAFGFAVSTLVGVAFGLLPAFQASRCDLQAGIQRGSARTAGGHQLTRRTLVIAEVALALVLLVGAGLLLRSLQRLFAVAPGFDPSHVLTMQVEASGHRFDDQRVAHRFFEQALEAVRQVPGVTAAAFVSQLPLSGDFEKYGVHLESSANTSPNEDQSVLRYAVSAGYFDAMGIPLRRGRLLDARDDAEGPVAVLVDESFAKRRFAGVDPIGQRLHLGRTDLPWYTVAGVVGNVKHTSLALTQSDAVYVPASRWYSADRTRSLVVRSSIAASGPGSSSALAAQVRHAIWSVDKDQPIARVTTMEDLVAASGAERRFALILFEAFALAALALAAIGIYGVLAGSVSERIREIGVRTALGASRADILSMVMRQGMSLTVAGALIGITGAMATSGALATLLFGVSRVDPATYLAVLALLAGVSGIACAIPAWRAARIDPAITLRAE